MKKYFKTGLAILLPILLTIVIVGFLINFLTKPFLGNVESFIGEFEIFNQSYFLFKGPEVIKFVSKMIILFFILSFILLVGFLGKLFLIDYLFQIGNSVFHNLPYINRIYKACQDVVHSLFSSSSKSFSQVVLVPFPTKNTLSVGLITKESIHVQSSSQASQMIPVFVPGTPNPSVGFMLMFKKEQLLFVNMKIEEAMKFVVSCGVIMSPFSVISPDDGFSYESPNA